MSSESCLKWSCFVNRTAAWRNAAKTFHTIHPQIYVQALSLMATVLLILL